MKRIVRNLLSLLVLLILPAPHLAAQAQLAPSVNKSTMAVAYPVDDGDTKVDLKGTTVMPGAKGEAKVEAKKDITLIEAKVERLEQPGRLGTQFLTYVLWAISPDGRTNNLGEILLNEDGKGELKVTSQLQTFSLIVTSEPYYSVRQPSELVVLENEVRKDTKGKLFAVDQYRLMKRAQYEQIGNPLALSLDTKNVPLQMYEARNAVDIAKSKGADKYASEIYSRADASLKVAENLLQRKADKGEIISVARQTVQLSEDARAAAVDKQEQERITSERAAAAEKARAEAEVKAEAKAAVDAAAARQLAQQEAQRQAELAAANEARLKAQAKAEADAHLAEANALQAKEAAARAETERVRKAAEESRAKLLEQLNRVLDTRDTPRGLVVNMADVLFDTGKYELRPEAREKLARLSGILATHPTLHLDVEGHTDSTGGVQLNQTLSDQRAQGVAKYLVDQGVPGGSVKAIGLADSHPVADNTTAEGRQKNRRVEIIVSGEEIGKTAGK
jgi:outer membrane protein OmpA-like peptidoglycan-associated protein